MDSWNTSTMAALDQASELHDRDISSVASTAPGRQSPLRENGNAEILTEYQPFLSNHLHPTTPSTPGSEWQAKPTGVDSVFTVESSQSSNGPTDRLNAWWIIEGLALLTSIAGLSVIIVILRIHDGQRFDSWKFYFSLNFVVSVLGSLARTSLIVAVSASLAQGKWIWFRKRSDTVNRFELIDSASRETWGSLKLLWYTKGRHLVALGAIVTILSVAIEPAFQALISDKGSLDSTSIIATVNRADNFDGGTQCVDQTEPLHIDRGGKPNQNISTTPDFAISAALYDGLNAALGGSLRDISFACSTGNCTWPSYASLAVCSACYSVTDHLVAQPVAQDVVQPVPQEYGTDTMPIMTSTSSSRTSSRRATVTPSTTRTSTADSAADENNNIGRDVTSFVGSAMKFSLRESWLELQNYIGSWRGSEFGLATLMKAAITSDPNSTVHFKNSQTLLAAFTIIRTGDEYANGTLPWSMDVPVLATECGLSLCLNVYESSISAGKVSDIIVATASEKVPASWAPAPQSHQPANQSLAHMTADILGTPHWNPIYHPIYIAREDYQLDATSLQHRANVTSTSFNVTQKALDSTVAYLATLIPLAANLSTVNITTSSLPVFGTPVLQPLYSSSNLTQTFEKVALSLSVALRGVGTPLEGTTKAWVIHYHIRWGWLALPISLVLLGTLFTTISIAQTQRLNLPAWKSSSLASMVHGPDDLLRARLRAAAMKLPLEKAAEVVVGLENGVFGSALIAVPEHGGLEERRRKEGRRIPRRRFESMDTLIGA